MTQHDFVSPSEHKGCIISTDSGLIKATMWRTPLHSDPSAPQPSNALRVPPLRRGMCVFCFLPIYNLKSVCFPELILTMSDKGGRGVKCPAVDLESREARLRNTSWKTRELGSAYALLNWRDTEGMSDPIVLPTQCANKNMDWDVSDRMAC